MKKLIAIAVILVYGHTAMAQYPRVDIPGSEVRKLTSQIVTGQEYELQVLLPGGYAGSTKKYPVVYLMDAQWDFPLVKSIYGQQYYDGFIPELIIVGVTWGGVHPNADSLRARDYTPTRQAGVPQSGGAEGFLSFMREELFPFMEKNYRVDGAHRSLMGCSLGGLFTLYTLFTYPDMFEGYAAASPAIGWDKEVIYQYEEIYAGNKSKPAARLYMTIGDVERNVPGFEKFSAVMEKRNYKELKWKPVVLNNTGHSGTKSETYSRGLQYIFERPDLKLMADRLNSYTGKFESAGRKAEIKVENEQLVIYFTGGNSYVLHAAGNDRFYSTAEFFNIHFSGLNGLPGAIVNGFELNRYGNTQKYQRIK